MEKFKLWVRKCAWCVAQVRTRIIGVIVIRVLEQSARATKRRWAVTDVMTIWWNLSILWRVEIPFCDARRRLNWNLCPTTDLITITVPPEGNKCGRAVLPCRSKWWHGYHWNSTHPHWTKWPPFRRRHFQMHFHQLKVLYFDSNFPEICS